MDPASLISDTWWTYVIIAAVIAGSAIFPPLPSESMLITALGFALAGRLDLLPAVLAAGVGSLGGDGLAYGLGRVTAGRREPQPGGRAATALAWLEHRRGPWLPALVVGGRFVPGGTTAVGLACGALRFPATGFMGLALVGATLWVAYGFAVATVGQAAAPDNPWIGIGIGILIVLVIAGTFALHQRVLANGRAANRATAT